MIGLIKGVPKTAGKNLILVETKSIGFLVYVPEKKKKDILKKKEITLYTHLVTRDNSMELFGFETQEEHTTFLTLISISGIGPKGALSILNNISPNDLMREVGKGSIDNLTSVYGISKKQAEKIIVELKDKNTDIDEGENNIELISALTSLGYDKKEIREALRSQEKLEGDFEEQLKTLLKSISGIL